MKFSSLVPSVLAAAGVAVASSAFSAAQAAVLVDPGADTCGLSDFTSYSVCGGYYSGNDSAEAIDGIFEHPGSSASWMEVVKLDDDDEGTSDTGMGVTLNVFDEDGQSPIEMEATSGTWSAIGLNYSKYKYAAAIKAGNSYSVYKLTTGTTGGDWDTLGVMPVGQNGNTPGLSHFTLYSKPVPEPLTILGSATALGIGGLLKREQSKKNKNNKA